MKNRQYSNMTEAIKGLKEGGYSSNFMIMDASLKDTETGRLHDVSSLKIVDSYRFEGESNPDDMAVLYVIEGNDGTKGIVIEPFGVYAREETAGFLDMIKDIRKTSVPTDILPSDNIK